MSTIRATKGDTTIYRFTCVDIDGVPVDLTSAALALDVRTWAGAADAVIEKTDVDGLTVVAPGTAGLVDLELEPADTADLEPGHYTWDLEVTMGDSVYTVDSGKFLLLGDVTRVDGS